MNSERTDHAAEAARVLRDVSADSNGTYADAMAYAQAHATLALVEQQRIANLIALSVPQELEGDATVWVSSYESSGLLRPEIREALGL